MTERTGRIERIKRFFLSRFSHLHSAFMLFYKVRKKAAAGKTYRRHTLLRYIASEALLYFSICFLFFFMVFFVNQMLLLAENVLKKRVPLVQVVHLVVYCMPFVIAQSAPFATLVGFLMCISRMAGQNEVVVMRASGVSYFFLSLPIMAMAIFISISSFFVNDYLLPLGTVRYNALYRKILTSNPAVELESRSVKKMNEATLITGDVNKEKVSSVVVIDTSEDKTRIISAKQSSLTPGKESGVLMRLEMNDVNALIIKDDDAYSYDEVKARRAVFNIFDTVFFTNQWRVSPREMTSRDLYKKIGEMEKDNKTPRRILGRYKTELQKKFSQPFGSLFFALLSLPLALLLSARGGQTAGMVGGVVISVVYWAVMITGQIAAGRLGYNPFLCMWAANFIAGAAGIILCFVLARK